MRHEIPFFSLAQAHGVIRAEVTAFLSECYDSNWYVLGQRLRQFEVAYAQWNHVRHCIGVGNGFDALVIALTALGIGPGDEVIVPSNTYIASWLAVTRCGATPVPVEPRPDTWNLAPEGIEPAITSYTKAIMPVHLYGQACEMGAIMQIAERSGLLVVEDNAQAHGAAYNGQLTGSFGTINATSFYPTKNLGALGDAGAVTTQDDQLADFCRTFGNYGSRQKYQNELSGINSRLDDIQAGVLSIKLLYLERWNEARLLLAQRYLFHLKGIPGIQLPAVATDCTHVWHLFVILVAQRDALQQHLLAHGIQTMAHYPIPPHLQGAYRAAGFRASQFPIAEQIARTCLSLPLYPGMNEDAVDVVCEEIRAFLMLEND